MAVGDLVEHSWASLAPYAATARTHPGGVVDLTVGNPVDPVPDVVREAVVAGADAHAYPAVEGSPALDAAIARWYARRRGVQDLSSSQVLPTIGSKELIGLLPLLLGLGPGDVVVHPRAAYPTYATGARLVGAEPVAADDPAEWPERVALVWLNSPGNPDGRVLDAAAMAGVVRAARARGAVLASDECYAELGWSGPWSDAPTPCVLHDGVSGGDTTGLLALYSLSKQSNLAGYRGAFAAGDPALIGRLLEGRRHLGLIPPDPVQRAMVAALDDDEHVAVQKARYRARRDQLLPAVRAAGFRVDSSEAGLFLWLTEGRDGWESVERLSRIGILGVPGAFYGPRFPEHVRLSLTASDAEIAEAARRLGRGLPA